MVEEGAQRHVVTIGFQIAQSAKDGEILGGTAAVAGRSARQARDLQTLIIRLEDEIDHAGDGVAAIKGRCAVFQNFNALDGGDGNRADIHRIAIGAPGTAAVYRRAATVDQNQCAAAAKTAQRNGRERSVLVAGVLRSLNAAGGAVWA